VRLIILCTSEDPGTAEWFGHSTGWGCCPVCAVQVWWDQTCSGGKN